MATFGEEQRLDGPIRVLLVDLPHELRGELRRSIAGQADMLLVDTGEPEPGDRIGLLAAANGVDVLVLGAADAHPPPGVCSHLLGEYPDLKILVVAKAGDAAATYWLGLRRRRLGQFSTAALVSGIRRAHGLHGLQLDV